MDINSNIKKYRKEANLTQKELAQKAGLSVATIQGYEQGKYKPKLNALRKIANALGVTVAELFEGVDLDGSPAGELIIDLDALDSPGNETLKTLINDAKKFDLVDFADNEARILFTLNSFLELLNEDGQKEVIRQMNLISKIPEYRKDAPPEEASPEQGEDSPAPQD